MRAAELERPGVGRGAIADAAGDALCDAGQAEQVVGEVPVEVGNGHAGHVAIDLRGLLLARDVQRLEVGVGEAGHRPLHQQIGEVGHGIAKRRQFPVEHSEHPRLGRVEDHVVETIVAVHDRDALLRRNGFRQPFGELLEFRDMLGLGCAILLGPAVDLAGKIIAGPAEIRKTDFLGVEGVEFRQCLDLAGEDFPPRFRRLARQRGIPEHAALLHRHDVEGRPDHGVIHAKRIGARNRKVLLAKCCDNAELAVDRMRRRQQFAERPAAHHIGTIGRIEAIGGVGLAALELQDGQRALVTRDILRQPLVEVRLVDAMTLLDLPCAGKFLVFSDAVGHRGAPSFEAMISTGIALGSAAGSSLFNGSERLHTSEVQVWQWRGYAPRPDRPRGAWCASRRSRGQDPRRRKRRRRHRPGSPGR